MGTSVSHPSPQTPKWKKVSDVYWDKHSGKSNLVQRLADTVTFKDLPSLSSPGVVVCVEKLIDAFSDLPTVRSGDINGVAGAVSQFRDTTTAALRETRGNSLETDIALRSASKALAQQLLYEGSGKPAGNKPGSPDAVVRQFLSHYLGEVFNHFTARDTGSALGNQRIPDSARLESIVRPATQAANSASQDRVVSGRMARHLQGYDRLPAQFRSVRIERALRDGLRDTLRILKRKRAA